MSAPRIWMTVDGLTGVTDTVARIEPEMRGIIGDTIEEATALIEREAYRRAPFREGTLRASIASVLRPDRLQGVIGSTDPKARFVEFETKDTRAQPFLRPAYRRGIRFIRQQLKLWGKILDTRIRFRSDRGRRTHPLARPREF